MRSNEVMKRFDTYTRPYLVLGVVAAGRQRVPFESGNRLFAKERSAAVIDTVYRYLSEMNPLSSVNQS